MNFLANSGVSLPPGHRVMTFCNAPQANIQVDLGTEDFAAVLRKLPDDFSPDAVLIFSPMYLPIPHGIEDSPYPVFAIVSDWNLGYFQLRENLKRFDHIFGDKAGVKVLKKLGYANVDYWPMFGHNVRKNFKMLGVDKKYDIGFAGNINHAIHKERSQWLYRLTQLPDHLSVRIANGIFNEEYNRFLNECRITFNRSIRGEMNMRAYEAAASGSLLFIESSNLEIGDFLEPEREALLYDEIDFEDMVLKYVENDALRVATVERAREKISHYTGIKNAGVLVSKIQDIISGKAWGKREQWKALPAYVRALEEGIQHILASDGKSTSGFAVKSLLAAAENSEESHVSLNAIAVFYLISGLSAQGRDKNDCLLKAENWLGKCLGKNPRFVPALFNKALLTEHLLGREQSIHGYLDAAAAAQGAILFNDFDGYPVLPNTEEIFPLWHLNMYHYRLHGNLDHIKSLFAAHCFARAGELLAGAGRLAEAGEALEKAAELLPASYKVHFLLAQVYKSRDLDTAIECLKRSFRLHPFFTETWYLLKELLQAAGRDGEWADFRAAIARVCSRFDAYRDHAQKFS